MDQEKKQTKCKIHSYLNNDLLLFEQDNIYAQICLACAKDLSNNASKMINIDEFLHADDRHIFSSFPPLQNSNLNKMLQNIQTKSPLQEIIIERIDQYFTTLKQEINTKIDLIKNETKAKILQMEDLNEFKADEFMKDYNEISSKFEIQNLYKKFDENSGKKLKEIIKEKYQNIQQNTQKLWPHLQIYYDLKSQMESKQPFEIQQKILALIGEINFLNEKLENLELQKSTYQYSQQFAIQRLQNKQIQIQQTVRDGWGIAYSNIVLDPMKKYIFRIRLQTTSLSDSYLSVGIIKEQNKDNSYLHQGICYTERGTSLTINKIVKGSNVYEGIKDNIDKEIEVRIHLAEKMIRVANYPNYENVAELQNKELIENNTQYRFAVSMHYQAHNMIITHYSVVDEFNELM